MPDDSEFQDLENSLYQRSAECKADPEVVLEAALPAVDMAQATLAALTPAVDDVTDEDEDVFYDAHEDPSAAESVPAASALDPLALSSLSEMSAYSMCDDCQWSDDGDEEDVHPNADNRRAADRAALVAPAADLQDEFELIDHDSCDALKRLLLTHANATACVLSFLDIRTLFQACRVSRPLHRAVDDPRVWAPFFDLLIQQRPELLTTWFVRDGTSRGHVHVSVCMYVCMCVCMCCSPIGAHYYVWVLTWFCWTSVFGKRMFCALAGALVQGLGVPLWSTYVDAHRALALASKLAKRRRKPRRSYMQFTREVSVATVVGACYLTGGVASFAVRFTGLLTGSVAGGVALGGLGAVGGALTGTVAGTLGGAYGGGTLLFASVTQFAGYPTFQSRPVAATVTAMVSTAAAAVGAAGGAAVGLVGGSIVGGVGGAVVGGGVGAYYSGSSVLNTIDRALPHF
jgi:hypothetical protein